MSQISPPIRIVLVAAIGLMAAWMLFLRPRTEATPGPAPAPATAPGVTGLSSAVDKAEGAAGAQEARDAKVQKATGEDAAAGEAGSQSGASTGLVSGRVLALEPLAGEQTEGLPAKVVRALEERRVLVVGVFDTKEKRWARMATDDRRVRRELAETNRYGGKVVVTRSSLGRLSKLNAIVGGVGVTQTPSVVVVDRNRKAVVLTGFVERNAINQAIQDARRNSIEVRVKEPFVRRLNETCANLMLRMDRSNVPTTRAGVKPALRRYEALMAAYGAAFASIEGKSRYRPLARQMTDVLAKGERFGAALRSGSYARMQTSATALLASDNGLDRKFAAAGATSCVFNRRS